MRIGLILLTAGAITTACTSTGPSSGGEGVSDGGAGGDGGGATFGPLDPGFANTPPGAWALSGGATIEAYVSGGIDPGVARFDSAKVMSPAFVSQTFAMPPFSAADRYVLETAGVGAGTAPSPGNSPVDFVQVRVDNMTLDNVVLGATLSKSRICLGERAFGHDISLAYATRGVSSNVDLDHVSIVPAPECPTAGIVLSGDFEAATGWKPLGALPGSVQEIASSGGTGNSGAAHLHADSSAEAVLVHEPVSFPWKSVPRPALRFSFKGTEGVTISAVDVQKVGSDFLRFALFANVPPATTLAPAFVCVPEWAKGLVLPITLRAASAAYAPPAEAVFDDLAFVSEPTCPESAHVIDGDFEVPATALSWSTSGSSITTAADAHAGQRYAALPVARQCAIASLSQVVTTPAAEPGRGPAVRFWYRTSAASQASFDVNASAAADELSDFAKRDELPAAPAWTAHTICLDAPLLKNRPTILTFSANGPQGSAAGCAATFPTETLAIDDVEVTTDPSCPAK